MVIPISYKIRRWFAIGFTTFLTLALPFFSDIRMLQNDPTLGPEIDAKQKKDGLTGTPLLIQVYEL